MSINKLVLKNFKRFEHLELDLKSKITLLMGPNSSGKSSIVKSILALKQTASPSNEHEVLSAQGDYVDLGIYRDFIHDHDTSKKLAIGFDIQANFGIFGGTPNAPAHLSFTFAYDFATEQAKVYEISVLNNNSPSKTLITLTKKKTRESFSLKLDRDFGRTLAESVFRRPETGIEKYVDTWSKGLSVTVVDRYQITPIESSSKRADSFTTRLPSSVISQVVSQQLRDFDKGFFYLGPLRRSPSRSYNRTAHLLSVGPNGEFTPSVLANLYSKAAKERGENRPNTNQIQQLNKWVETIFPGTSVASKTMEELVKIEITRGTDQREVITDVGFGFSQVLPILVQLSVMPEDATLLIEQPELHLHPSAQTKLATIFSEAANSNKKVIIETHSEHLLRGLQVCISNKAAKKGTVNARLKNTDVSIKYVPRHPEKVKTIGIDEYGELTDNWPSGFFDEAFNSSFKLISNKFEAINGKSEKNSIQNKTGERG